MLKHNRCTCQTVEASPLGGDALITSWNGFDGKVDLDIVWRERGVDSSAA